MGPTSNSWSGAYSDNQPDYSWLQPYEGQLVLDELVSVPGHRRREEGQSGRGGEPRGGGTEPRTWGSARLRVKRGPRCGSRPPARSSSRNRSPSTRASPIGKMFPFRRKRKRRICASISAGGKELVSYTPIVLQPEPMPQPDRPPPPPAEIKTGEELYLTGLRIEQFHDPAGPEPLPGTRHSARSRRRAGPQGPGNPPVQASPIHRGRDPSAQALERLTAGYASPRDGEPYYYLGLALREQGRTTEAGEVLFKATWSLACSGPAYFALAELATRRHDLATALELVDRSIAANASSTRALNLKAAILRHLERPQDALKCLEIIAATADPLDVRCMAERWLISKSSADARSFTDTMMAHPATAAETAGEYQTAGLWEDGRAALAELASEAAEGSRLSPMLLYDLAFFSEKLGDECRDRVSPPGRQGFARLRIPFSARGDRGPPVPRCRRIRTTRGPRTTWATCCLTGNPRKP